MRNPAPSGRRIAGLRVRNLNALLGAFLGLDRWAIEEEMLRSDDLVRACKERGVSLSVLGPTPAWTNAAISRRLSGGDVPYALIEQLADPAGHPLVRADGIHLTVDGHRFVAEQLFDHGMRDWVAGILAASGEEVRNIRWRSPGALAGSSAPHPASSCRCSGGAWVKPFR